MGSWIQRTPTTQTVVGALVCGALFVVGCADEPSPCEVETVQEPGFEIFRYEASLPDATAAGAGADRSGLCSQAGGLPLRGLTFAEARAACQQVDGFDLCSLQQQWQQACGGPAGRTYPWGSEDHSGRCNDYRESSESCVQPCGARSECATPAGTLDLVGNVWEWAAAHQGPADGLGCSADPASDRSCDRLLPEQAGSLLCLDGSVCVRPVYAGGGCRLRSMDVHIDANRCSTYLFAPLSYSSQDVGFRCCR